MKKALLTGLSVVLGAAVLAPQVLAQGPDVKLDRTVLPIAEPNYPHSTVLDARDAKAPPRFEVKAPAGAPNVLIVLVDDMGFGMSSAFGGPVRMPAADRLATQGLRYNQFHTTALCSPTRTALLSGRNHHTNNMGSITETATAFPGNTGQRPNNVAPLAEMLRLNGYSTAFFGKNHETAPWEVSPSGPTDRWPTRSGFDKFYGFFGGETDQWNPTLYDGMARVPTPHYPGYNFMTDMTTSHRLDEFRSRSRRTSRSLLFRARRHPARIRPQGMDRQNKGRFEVLDKLRDATLARQIALGVVPPGTKRPPSRRIKIGTSCRRRAKALCPPDGSDTDFGEYCDQRSDGGSMASGALGQHDNPLISTPRRQRTAPGAACPHVQRDELFQ